MLQKLKKIGLKTQEQKTQCWVSLKVSVKLLHVSWLIKIIYVGKKIIYPPSTTLCMLLKAASIEHLFKILACGAHGTKLIRGSRGGQSLL